MATAARVAELKRIYAEGAAANVGAANPYYGQLVNAAVWRGGYRRMLDAMLANSEARQAYLRARKLKPTESNKHSSPGIAEQ